jgi:hypothetical protein
MKKLISFFKTALLFLVTNFSLLAQEQISSPAGSANDTLVVTDLELVKNPFGLGENPLQFLLTKLGYMAIKEKKDYFGEGGAKKEKLGAWYKLQRGADSFEIYKRADGVEFLTAASLTTSYFSAKQGIKVGISKARLKKCLKLKESDAIPAFLLIGDPSFSYMVLECNDKKLVKIRYEGYLD